MLSAFFKILNYLYITLYCQSFKTQIKSLFFASVTISSSVVIMLCKKRCLIRLQKGVTKASSNALLKSN